MHSGKLAKTRRPIEEKRRNPLENSLPHPQLEDFHSRRFIDHRLLLARVAARLTEFLEDSKGVSILGAVIDDDEFARLEVRAFHTRDRLDEKPPIVMTRDDDRKIRGKITSIGT